MRSVVSIAAATASVIALFAWSTSAVAAPTKRSVKAASRHAAPAADPWSSLDSKALEEAGQSVRKCISDYPESARPYVLCSDVWRGIKYMIFPDYRTELSIPNLSNSSEALWTIRCSQDKMSDAISCTAFHRLDKFNSSGVYVIQSYNARALVWGKNSYPGTTPQVRFGRGQPLSVSGDLMTTPAIADGLISLMRLNDQAIFRYVSWPERRTVDIEIDTSRYREFEALMGAIFGAYRNHAEGG